MPNIIIYPDKDTKVFVKISRREHIEPSTGQRVIRYRAESGSASFGGETERQAVDLITRHILTEQKR